MHIYVHNKIKVGKSDWLATDLLEIEKYSDPSRNAQQAVVLITRDGVGRFAFTEDNQYSVVERISR